MATERTVMTLSRFFAMDLVHNLLFMSD